MRNRAFFFFLLIIFPAISYSSAQTIARDTLKERAIEKQLEKITPALVPIFHEATLAMDNSRYLRADSLYTRVMLLAPEFDVTYRRLGYLAAVQGKKKQAINLFQKAVDMNRSADNLYSLAAFIASSIDTRSNMQDSLFLVLDLLGEAERLPGGEDASFPALIGQVALLLRDNTAFREAAEKLQNRYPELMETHYFSAILAAMNEQWQTAVDEIHKAEKLGLPRRTVREFLDSGVQTKAEMWQITYSVLWAVAVWVAGLLLLYLAGKLLSSLTLRSISSADSEIPVSNSEQLLRKIYRIIINIAGTYYYISLPVIIVIILFVTASVFYGLYVAGRIPINLVLILGGGAMVTIYQAVTSLFVKLESEEPGRELAYEEAPGLWELTKKVALDINTRPVDEIRVTYGTEIGVYERGTRKEKMNDEARRILILGIASLNNFKQNDFCAVLAHEYGHFSHRDTAGGEIAMRVQGDMYKFFLALYREGQATWWNVAFQFLRLYSFIFKSISYGASRLQEILADRISAKTYGPLPFKNGLKHVIRSSIEFGYSANREIETALKVKRPVQNLYELPGEEQDSIDLELQKELCRKTGQDDTHPCPAERFRLVSKVNFIGEACNAGLVWDLFIDKNALTREMTSLVEENVRKGLEAVENGGELEEIGSAKGQEENEDGTIRENEG